MAKNTFFHVRVGNSHVHTAKTLKQAQKFAAGQISIVEVAQTWDDTTDDIDGMNMTVTETVVS